MESYFIEEIPKTQNYLFTEENKKEIIENDFFYSNSDFIGKHIEIKFTRKDIVNSLQYGCEGIKDIIYDTIQLKKEEYKQTTSILIDYELLNITMDENGIRFIITITKCEADC